MYSEKIEAQNKIFEMQKPLMLASISQKLVGDLNLKLQGVNFDNGALGEDIKVLKKCLSLYDGENRRLEIDGLRKNCLVKSLLGK